PDMAKLRSVVERTRPLSLAEQRLLPLTAATEHLLPRGGLVRGSCVEFSGASGATTLALSMLAGPCNSGSWVAVVGFEELGWESAEEVGVPLERLVALRCPPGQSTRVVAALLDSFDMVLCGPRFVPSQAELRKLRARARERGAVLLGVAADGYPADGYRAKEERAGGSHAKGYSADRWVRRGRPWPASDVRLVVRRSRWQGLGQGFGRLAGRRLEVLVTGRGEMSRPRVEEVRYDSTGRPVAAKPVQRLAIGGGLAVLGGTGQEAEADSTSLNTAMLEETA
ncbi:MAG: hypothetical protein ACR2OH_08975, partial [Microthrixaceae bacterium]